MADQNSANEDRNLPKPGPAANGSPEEEQVEEKLSEWDEKLREAGSTPMPEVPLDDLDRLIGARADDIREARRRSGFDEAGKAKRNQKGGTYHRLLGIGLAVGYNLAGCVLGGFLIGFLIDMPTKGQMGTVIGTIIGAVVGMIAAILVILNDGPSRKKK
ncbi:MAG: hypothetical protein MUC92_11815 [Fimbriimonadaceae bacterium]|jgi:F0F1-type ATP synthase assembly protein I|nr:hypothetical protein [Fimbriimonadaceae bacterium]